MVPWILLLGTWYLLYLVDEANTVYGCNFFLVIVWTLLFANEQQMICDSMVFQIGCGMHYKKTRLLWLRPFDWAWLGSHTCSLLVILVPQIWLQSSGNHDFSHIRWHQDGNAFENMFNAFWNFKFNLIRQFDWR